MTATITQSGSTVTSVAITGQTAGTSLYGVLLRNEDGDQDSAILLFSSEADRTAYNINGSSFISSASGLVAAFTSTNSGLAGNTFTLTEYNSSGISGTVTITAFTHGYEFAIVEAAAGSVGWFTPNNDCNCEECLSCVKGPNSGTTCSLVVNGTTVDEVIWEITAMSDPFRGGITPGTNHFQVTGIGAFIAEHVADLSALGNSFGCRAFVQATTSCTWQLWGQDGIDGEPGSVITDSGSGTAILQINGGSTPSMSVTVDTGSGTFFVWSTTIADGSIDICNELPPTEFETANGSTITLKMTHGFDP